MAGEYHPGLENVVACETEISYLDVEHEEIVIRGYNLIELAKQREYIDVAHLILKGDLPEDQERLNLEAHVFAESILPDEVFSIFKLFPSKTHLMDALRTGVSVIAGYDDELEDRSPEANYRKAIRLIAKIPQIVASSYHLKMKESVVKPLPYLRYSANFLYMITKKIPIELETKIFDQCLIMYSEHEMPNSTFTARVIASTQSDIYGALTGAVASLKGTLHGGANEAVMHLLLEANTPDQMEPLMQDKLARKDRIMGFGHRVYMKKMDPRAQLLKEATERLAREQGRQDLFEMCCIGEEVMKREKGLYPNLDYYAAPVFHLLGIPIDLFTPIFLAARSVGLSAHVMEQHSHNRLFRPRVNYLGPRNLQAGTACK